MLPIILALMALAASFVKSTSPGWARLLEQPVKLRRGVVGTDGLRVLSVGRGVTAALGGAKAAGGCGVGYGSKNGAGDAKLTEGRPQPSTAWPYTPYGQAEEDDGLGLDDLGASAPRLASAVDDDDDDDRRSHGL
jgi:hypothetical protein